MLSRGFVPRQFLDDKPADGPAPPRDYAVIAYRIADAMLAARSTDQQNDLEDDLKSALFRIIDIAEGDGTARAAHRISDIARRALGVPQN
jgi:hypothetical protein